MISRGIKLDEFRTRGKRFDASFHLSTANESKRLIDKCPNGYKTLAYLTSDIYKGNIFKRVYVSSKNHGIAFLTASDMFKATISGGKYVSKKYTKRSNLMLQNDSILVSRSGSVGNTVYITDDMIGKMATDDMIRINVDESKYDNGLLYAFLKSKFGYSLLSQSEYGGVVKHIEPHHIQNIKIPVFETDLADKISTSISSSMELRASGRNTLKSITDQLNKIVGFSKDDKLLQSSEHVGSISYQTSSDSFTTRTFRARNYGLRKRRIVNQLSKGKVTRLGNLLQQPPFYGARFKRVDSTSASAVELLSQGNLFDMHPKGRKISPLFVKNIDSQIVKKGSTLIPAQGTLGENEIFGRAKFVYGYLENKTVAGHVMRFVPDEDKVDSGYLHAVLSSDFWFRLLRSSVYGTNLLGFIVPMICDLPIPRLSSNEEKRIGNLVRECYDNLSTALNLENQAISLIEKEIESWQ